MSGWDRSVGGNNEWVGPERRVEWVGQMSWRERRVGGTREESQAGGRDEWARDEWVDLERGVQWVGRTRDEWVGEMGGWKT